MRATDARCAPTRSLRANEHTRRSRAPRQIARARARYVGRRQGKCARVSERILSRETPADAARLLRARPHPRGERIPPPRFREFLQSSMARGLVAYPGGSASRISHAEARRASHASCEVVRALGRGSRGPSRLSPTLHFLHIRHFSKTKVPTSPLTIFSPSSLALMYIGPRIRPHSASVILHGGRRWHVTRERGRRGRERHACERRDRDGRHLGLHVLRVRGIRHARERRRG